MKARRVDFYPDDWLAGTMALGNADRGLYITACAMIYSHGGSITINDLFAFCRDHGNSLNAQLNRLVAAGKLQRKGSEIYQKRSRKELEKATKRLINAVKNGRKGGRPPKDNNDLAKPNDNPEAKFPLKLPSPSPSPLRKKEEPPIAPLRVARDDDPEFAAFWAAYPRRQGKGAARKAWAKATKTVEPEVIIEAASRYAKSRNGDDPRFTKQPGPWLNDERWSDEAELPMSDHQWGAGIV